jgi:cholesterol transport system auxiliary component
VLTGCSLLGKREDLTVYAPAWVHRSDVAAAHRAREWQLGIVEPRAIGPLDGTRIAVMPAAGQIETYKGARWRDSAPVLVQQLLLQAFQDSASLAGVGAPTSVLHADFALQSDLQDFQTEYRGARLPTVVIRLNGQLVDNSSGRILASRTFTAEQPCAGSALPEVFSAFQVALNQMLPQVVEWATATGDASWNRRAPER